MEFIYNKNCGKTIYKANFKEKQFSQEELTDILDNASKLYYAGKESPISDTDFDLMLKLLQDVEKSNGIVLPNSPTKRVGSDIQKEFKKCKHPEGNPMLTIENTYNDNELINWFKKITEDYSYSGTFVAEPKYDGISCELHYVNGILKSAATRGDKNIGDDITANVLTIKSVPLSLDKSFCDDFYVRGEILLTKQQLKILNKEKIEKNEKPFANCRNACAGSVKQLDPKVTASRNLIFRPWDAFIYANGKQVQLWKNHSDKFKALKTLGFVFEIEPITFAFDENSINRVNEFHAKVNSSIGNIYDCDGIVIKVNDIELENKIGTKDYRAIEWGIARKWNEEKEVVTKLIDIDFQVGRTGNITPVGKLEPVLCDGVIISNVTLNNESFIKNLGLKLYSSVRIVRSGSVIPYCVGLADKQEEKEQFDIEFPKVCPACGEKLVKTGEILKCVNDKCPAKVEKKILHWCSKDAMDIPTIGPSVVKKLIDSGLVLHPFDLYFLKDDLTVEKICKRLGAGFGEVSVKKILDNIDATYNRPLNNLIYAFGIEGCGKRVSKLLADTYKDLYKLFDATEQELQNLPTLGPVLAHNIFAYINENKDMIVEFLNDKHLNTSLSDKQNESDTHSFSEVLKGKNIVFTGKSSHYEGDKIEEFLESLGAKCSHSVTKKTDWLVTGNKPGLSKVSKANELGIKIMTEKELFSLLG